MLVSHPKHGAGKIITFYEFYNHIFVDVLFEGYNHPHYLRYDTLKLKKDNESSNNASIL